METNSSGNLFGKNNNIYTGVSQDTLDKISGLKKSDIEQKRTLPLGRVFQDIETPSFTKELPKGMLLVPDRLDSYLETIAQNQSIPELAGKALFNTLTEFTGGLIEGIGSLPELPSRIIGSKDAFEKNFMEELGSGITEWGREVAPIYQTQDARENLALGDATFWANLVPSMASSLSIFLPVMGSMKIASLLGNVSKAAMFTRLVESIKVGGKLAKGLEGTKILSLGERMIRNGMTGSEFVGSLVRASKLAGKSNFIFDTLTPAIMSRSLDSSREATGRYLQVYNQYKDSLGEKEARELAAEAAHKGFVASGANIVFDVIEWSFLGGALSKMDKTLTNRVKTELFKNKSFTSSMTDDGIKAAKNSLFQSKLFSKLGDYGKVAISEGFDETFMDFFMNEGTRSAKINKGLQEDDNTNFLERLVKHHGVAKNYESFIGGVLGGTAMSAFSDIHGTLKYKYFDKQGQQYVTNIANSFFERASETDKSLKTINTLLNTSDETNANVAKIQTNYLLAKIMTKSAMSNSLDLDIERLKQIANINISDPKNKTIVDSLNLTKEAQDNIKYMVKTLESNASIYSSEFSKVWHKDDNINRTINAQVAEFRTLQNLNNKHLAELKDDTVIDEKVLEEQAQTILNNLDPEASQYYSQTKHYNKEVKSLENKKATLTAQKASIQAIVDSHVEQISKASNQHQEATLSATVKAFEGTIKNIEEDLATTESKINKLKEEREANETTFKNKDSYKSTIESILENENTVRNTIGKSKNIRDVLIETNNALDTNIKSVTSPEQIKLLSKVYEAANEESANELVNKFEIELEALDNEKDIKKLLKKYIGENTGFAGEFTYKGNKITVGQALQIAMENRIKNINKEKKENKKAEEDNTIPEVVVIEPTEATTTSEVTTTPTAESLAPSSLPGLSKFPQPRTQIERAIIEHSEEVSKNEDNHTYTYKGKTNTHSASQLRGHSEPTDEKNKKNLKAAYIVGKQVDKLVRDFFNDDLKDSVYYDIKDIEQYNKLIEYLNKLKAEFSNKGLRVLAQGIKVFDETTGVAGEIDLLLIDEQNNCYIYDVKTTKNQLSNDANSVNKISNYTTQLNVYAKLLSRQFEGLKVKGLGLLFFDVSYNIGSLSLSSLSDKESNNGTLTINSITPSSINDNLFPSIEKDNGTIMSQYKFKGTNNNTSLLEFPLNNKALAYETDIIGTDGEYKTISELFDTPVMGEDLKISEVLNIDENQLAKQYLDTIETLENVLKNLSTSGTEGNVRLTIENIINKLRYAFVIIETDGKKNINVTSAYITVQQTLASIKQENFRLEYISDYIDKIYSNEELAGELQLIFGKDTVSGNPIKTSLYNLANELDKQIKASVVIDNKINNVEILDNNVNRITEVSHIIVGLFDRLKQYDKTTLNNQLLDIVYLATHILELKKNITSNENNTLNYDEVIMLIVDAFNIVGEHSISEIKEFIDILPAAFKLIKDSYKIKLKDIVLREIQTQNKGWTYDSNTFDIFDENGKPVSDLDISDIFYSSYHTFYNMIDFESKFNNTNFNFKDYVDNIIKNYEQTLLQDTSKLQGKLNSNLPNDSKTHKTILGLRTTKQGIEGTKTFIKLNNGVIEVYVEGLDAPLSIIESIESSHKDFKFITTNGIEINEIIENKLFNDLLNNEEFTNLLKEVQKHRLVSKASNRSNSEKRESNSIYEELINNIQTSNDSKYKNFRDFLNLFVNIEDVSNNDINKVLDIVFYNQYLNYFNSYKVTPSSIKKNITKFQTISKLNKEVFDKTIKAIDSFDSIESVIGSISLPSINFINKEDSKGNVVKRPSLKDSIKPLGNDTKPTLVVYKDGNLSNADSRKPLPNVDLSQLQIKGRNGVYIVIPTVDGKVSTVKVRENTLANSYGENGNKAVTHVKSSVTQMIDDAIQSLLVKGKVQEVKQIDSSYKDELVAQLTSVIESNNLKNIIIYKGTADNNDFDYFTTNYFLNEESGTEPTIDFVMKFKVITPEGLVYHRIEVNKNGVYHASISEKFVKGLSTIPNDKGFQVFDEELYRKKLSNFLQRLNNPTRNSEGNQYNVNLIKVDEEKLSKILDEAIPNLARQSNYDENGNLSFVKLKDGAKVESITDPITGKVYDNAFDYILDTDAVYNYIGAVTEEGGTEGLDEVPISNINLFDGASIFFGLDVLNVTSLKKGEIENAIDLFSTITETTKPELLPIMDVIRNMVSTLGDKYKNLTITHIAGIKGEGEFQNVNVAQTSRVKVGDSLNMRIKYVDKLLKYSNQTDNSLYHPILGFLHEQLHVLMTSVTELEITDENKESIKEAIKLNNKSIEEVILNFENDFKVSLENEEYISKLKEIFKIDDSNTIINQVNNVIDLIKRDVISSNKNLDSDIISDGMAQELYAYFSNPYFMGIFSITKPTNLEYTRRSNKNFIDTIIDTLIEIFNKIVGLFGGTYKISDENYTKIIKDIFSDYYYSVINPTNKEVKPKEKEVKSEEIESETKRKTLDRTKRNRLSDRDINYVNNLQDSNNNVIFKNEKEYLDDTLNTIC